MANYNNNRNYNYNGGGYANNSGGFRGNYSRNQNQNYNRNNAPKRGRSGASYKNSYTTKAGEHVTSGLITGWKYTRTHGKISLIATRRVKDFQCPKAIHYQKWVCKIQPEYGKAELFNGLYNTNTGKLYIPDLNMVASPRGANGGFFGKITKR